MSKCTVCHGSLRFMQFASNDPKDNGSRMVHVVKEDRERCRMMKSKPLTRRYYDPVVKSWKMRSR